MTVLTQAARMSTNASTIHSLVSQGKWSEALSAINRQADLHADLAALAAIEAYRAGFTQKQIAALLGVSPSTLRGIKQEASASV